MCTRIECHCIRINTFVCIIKTVWGCRYIIILSTVYRNISKFTHLHINTIAITLHNDTVATVQSNTIKSRHVWHVNELIIKTIISKQYLCLLCAIQCKKQGLKSLQHVHCVKQIIKYEIKLVDLIWPASYTHTSTIRNVLTRCEILNIMIHLFWSRGTCFNQQQTNVSRNGTKDCYL